MAEKNTTGTKVNASTAKKSDVQPEAEKKRSATSSDGKKGKTSAEDRRRAQRAAEAEELAAQQRRERRTKNMTWILILVGAVLLILMIFDWVSIFGMKVADGDPGTHLLGIAGFYFFHALYGVFGYGMILIPAALFWLGIRWRSSVRERTVVAKIVSACTFLLLFSAMLHLIFNWTQMRDQKYTWEAVGRLFNEGQRLRSGGVLGGSLSVGLMKLLRYVGSLIVYIIGLCVSLVFFLGLDPTVIIDRIQAKVQQKAQLRAQEHAAQGAKKREESERRKQEAAHDAALKKAERAAQKEAARREALAAKEKAEEEEPDESDTEDAAVSDDGENTPAPVAETGDNRAQTAPAAKAEDEEASVGESDAFDDDAEAERVFPRNGGARYTDRASAGAGDIVEDEDIEVDMPQEATDADMPDAPLPEGYERADDDDSVLSERYKDDTVGAWAHAIYDGETAEKTADGNEGVKGGISAAQAGENADETAEEGDEKEHDYVFPPLTLLKEGSNEYGGNPAEMQENIAVLRQTLESFRIKVKDITGVRGPTITRYEVKPEAGVRVHAISNLQDDIALALAKSGVRIEAPIPGKPAVGIEVPNDNPSAVNLRNLLEAPDFVNHKSKIAAALGADVAGKPVICDIEKMPHLLIAGTTGSGKSVCINSIIMSILYHAKPEEVKLILIDPKKVEFNVYKDIPHLCTQIVSDPKRAAGALQSAVTEMEHRFELIEDVGVRNIQGYNEITKNDPERPFMPRIVIIIDELADLMMTAPDEVETAICRIAQKARAAGIYLIIGTQRPSVDVITGLIKANVPSRIAFTVASQVDSRTIIDISGAEKLCGRGDMLYAPVGSPKPKRVQGAFVSDAEVEEVVSYVKSHNTRVHYDEVFTRHIDEEAANVGNAGKKAGDGGGMGTMAGGGDDDAKLWEAVELAVESGKISTSLMQRRLEVGYGRAAKIIDRMEELGFVGPADGNKPRKILITKEDIAQLKMNGQDPQN